MNASGRALGEHPASAEISQRSSQIDGRECKAHLGFFLVTAPDVLSKTASKLEIVAGISREW